MTEEEKEYACVSKQSDEIVLYMQNRFQHLLEKNQMNDAIAVGDEYFEWIRQDPDEVFLYYNELELQEQYKQW